MNLSEAEWRDVVVVFLRKRLNYYARQTPWLLHGTTADDIIHDVIVKYLSAAARFDAAIQRLKPDSDPKKELPGLLLFMCRCLLIDKRRRNKRDCPLPESFLLSVTEDPRKMIEFNIMLDEVSVCFTDPGDRKLWESFRRVIEGPIVTPAKQVSEQNNIPQTRVYAFLSLARSRLSFIHQGLRETGTFTRVASTEKPIPTTDLVQTKSDVSTSDVSTNIVQQILLEVIKCL